MEKPDLKVLAAGVGVTSDCPEALKQFYGEFSPDSTPACDLQLIDRLQTQYNLFGEFCDLVKQAAKEINEDALRSLWIKLCGAFALNSTSEQAKTVPVPVSDGTLVGDFLPLYILLPQIPGSIETYRSRGFSQEEINKLLPEYLSGMRVVKRQTGRPGINSVYYNWLTNFAKAMIFTTDGLQFEIFHLPQSNLWLKNRFSGELLALPAAGHFHASGKHHCGMYGYEDTEGSFKVSFEEDEQNFYGHSVADNVVSAQKQTFSKEIWECVVRPGGECLNFHIPEGADISVENLALACANARKIAARSYPEHNNQVIYGVSWILDPALEKILGEKSKITGLIRSFCLCPCRDAGMGVFSFVFPRYCEDFHDLPENTSLQRKIKQLYLEGGRIYAYSGIFKI
ncbi:MAG: hypothetical protein IKC95_01545 [Oscillospiraceae bacterium]|nr:hypothetical protein [Oscillospiraceae bacterium]